jgi:hypothetical protein
MAAQWLSYALRNYQAELYPTRIRARGIFLFVAVCMAVVILSVAATGPLTRQLEVAAIAH